MGRPLKIKKSTTSDIGFNAFSALTAPVVPTGFTPGSDTEYEGVVGGEGNGGGVATSTYPVVKCRVYITGQSEEDGWIVRQKGSTKYLVQGTSSGEQGVCTLADEADSALTEGNMNITFTLNDSTAVTIARLTNKFALDYSDNRYTVNFFTDEGTVTKSGAEGATFSNSTGNLDLAIVENYTS